MIRKTSFMKAFINVIFLLVSAVGGGAYATQLTYSDGHHPDGFSLPGLRPAGQPNFENNALVQWNRNKGVLQAKSIGGDFLFNVSPTESYAVTNGRYELTAYFDPYANFLTGTVSISGKLSIDEFQGSSVNADGLLMFATLESFAYSEDLIGFNTTGIVCPWFNCTNAESAYLSLNRGGFNTDLKNFNSTGLAVTTTPIPGAVWLFGSGLIGLVGAARRRKN